MMMFLAQAVVAFQLAGTNSAVGVVSLGVGVSMLLVGPFGGVTADRVSKRTLIILGQGAAAALLVLTGVLIITDTLSLLLLVLITTVMGLGFAFMGPARHAYVADIVAPERLANAIALSQLGHSGGQILAPLLAGILLSTAAIGAGGVYLLMGALLFIGVASIGFLPSRAGPPHARGSVLSELGAGLQHVRSRPRLRLVLLMYVAVVMLGWSFRVVLPALLERDLDRAATDIGLLFSVNAIAGFVVSLGLAGLVGTRWAWPALFVLATLLALGYFVLAAAPTFGFALLLMVLLGPGIRQLHARGADHDHGQHGAGVLRPRDVPHDARLRRPEHRRPPVRGAGGPDRRTGVAGPARRHDAGGRPHRPAGIPAPHPRTGGGAPRAARAHRRAGDPVAAAQKSGRP